MKRSEQSTADLEAYYSLCEWYAASGKANTGLSFIKRLACFHELSTVKPL